MTSPHLMLDLETLGTKSGCIVLTLGAAKYDPATGEVLSKFYRKINVKESMLLGLRCDPATYAWWQKQSEESRKEAFSGTDHPREVVRDFAQWAHEGSKIENWWAQGIDFDYPIFEGLHKVLNQNTPWQFWAKRDTRTLYSVAGFDPKSITRTGTYHNALEDSLHQIKCVCASYRLLGLGKPEAQDEEVDEL